MRPSLLLPLTTLGLASLAASSRDITYSTVGGYFLQDEPDTNASGFDYVRQPLDTSYKILNDY